MARGMGLKVTETEGERCHVLCEVKGGMHNITFQAYLVTGGV